MMTMQSANIFTDFSPPIVATYPSFELHEGTRLLRLRGSYSGLHQSHFVRNGSESGIRANVIEPRIGVQRDQVETSFFLRFAETFEGRVGLSKREVDHRGLKLAKVSLRGYVFQFAQHLLGFGRLLRQRKQT